MKCETPAGSGYYIDNAELKNRFAAARPNNKNPVIIL